MSNSNASQTTPPNNNHNSEDEQQQPTPSTPIVISTTKRKAKSDTKQNRIGEIKVTRNIRARKVDKRIEPINFPESGVLYEFNVKDWENKMAFYDQIAYSFGVPSTQKTVFCSYLNCHVMHYERTCQGVYYCPHIGAEDESSGSDNICTVKPCRYRFQQCEHHKTSLKKSDERCKLKLHFYVPKDSNNHVRLLLCIGDHNHPLIPESFQASHQQQQQQQTDSSSSSPPLTPMSATSDVSPVVVPEIDTHQQTPTDYLNRTSTPGYSHQMRNSHSSIPLTKMGYEANLPPQYSAQPPQYSDNYHYHHQQHQQPQLDYPFGYPAASAASFNYAHQIPAKMYEVSAQQPQQYRNNNTMPVPAYQASTSLHMQQAQQNIMNAQKKRIFTLMNNGAPAEEDMYRPAKRIVMEDRVPTTTTNNVLPSISTFFASEQAPHIADVQQEQKVFQQQQQMQPAILDNQFYYTTRTQSIQQQLSLNPPGYYQVISQQKVQQGPPVYQQAPPPYRFQ